MNYEQTRIYQCSLDLVSLTRQVIAELPTGHGFLADQLRRAASSIVLTFAEGYDKGSLAEQRSRNGCGGCCRNRRRQAG